MSIANLQVLEQCRDWLLDREAHVDELQSRIHTDVHELQSAIAARDDAEARLRNLLASFDEDEAAQ